MESKHENFLLECLEILLNKKHQCEEKVQKTFLNERKSEIQGCSENKKLRKEDLLKDLRILKDFIQQRNEEGILKNLAKIISYVTSEEQKTKFIMEMKKNNKNDCNSCSTDADYSDDIIIPRSGVPQEMDETELHSIDLQLSNDQFILLSNYNSDTKDIYITEKGIEYCKILLTKSFEENDQTFIKELKFQNALNNVLNNRKGQEKSYLMNLADGFPVTFPQIQFIRSVDNDSILKSFIFAYFAHKNLNILYNFLVKLINEKIDKVELCKCCFDSTYEGVKFIEIFEKKNQSQEAKSKTKIEEFLNKYKIE